MDITNETKDLRHRVIWLNDLGRIFCDLGEVEQALRCYQEAQASLEGIAYYQGKACQLLGIGMVSLFVGEYFMAQQYLAEALVLDIPETSQAALALGIVALYQRSPAVGKTFVDAVAHCQTILDKTANLYEPRYTLATALVGQAVCDPRWADASQRTDLLAPALAEYRRALGITSSPGVVGDALRDLEWIRKAGVDGLEPVSELLQGALPTALGQD